MLPGAGDTPQDFVNNGFYRAVQESKIPADVRIVDTHIGYFRDRSLVERLDTDVVLPAIRDGYREIWFAGISLGGLGALIYARAHPDRVSGVVLLAPYLGPRDLIQEIASAGGIGAWQPPATRANDDYQSMWVWLQTYATKRDTLPVIYLGYGLGDRFAAAHAELARLLPKEQVVSVSGNHDWTTWKRLWPRLLNSMALSQ